MQVSWLEPIVVLIEPRGDVLFFLGKVAGAELTVAYGNLRAQLRRCLDASVGARVDRVLVAEKTHMARMAILVDQCVSLLRVAVGEWCGLLGERARHRRSERWREQFSTHLHHIIRAPASAPIAAAQHVSRRADANRRTPNAADPA